MARSTTETCCLTLPLVLEKWQTDQLEKRFEIARQIYNSILNYELKKLRRLERNEEYSALQEQIRQAYADGKKESPDTGKLIERSNRMRQESEFSEYSFKSDAKRFYKHFRENIGSNVTIHGIAPQVWAAFEKYFYGNGKAVHFKKRGELNSLRGYSRTGQSGGVEIMFRGTLVEWIGLKLPVKPDKRNTYETEMLERRVKYCRILRKPGKHKSRWYVQLMLEGKPAVKYRPDTGEVLHPVGSGPVGIDIGPQTVAYAAKTETGLMELADQVQNIEHEKKLIQRKLDRSRRASNPENYAQDGTIRRGVKLTHNKSKRYRKLQRELAWIQSRQAETRKRQHNELANHLLSLGDRFYVENMDWPALTHRAWKTEISEKTGRYKRKKRFGKSVANKAPQTLITTLSNKLKSRGLNGVTKVPTRVRASQYNHITDTYQKKDLNQRWNVMPDGKRIQRDLYSAFLLQHMNEARDGFDRSALITDYEPFVRMHDATIRELGDAPKTIASMGIVRTAG